MPVENPVDTSIVREKHKTGPQRGNDDRIDTNLNMQREDMVIYVIPVDEMMLKVKREDPEGTLRNLKLLGSRQRTNKSQRSYSLAQSPLNNTLFSSIPGNQG